MDFALTTTQADIRDAARRYLDQRYPPDRLARIADTTGFDPDGWPEITRAGWLDPQLGTVELGLLAEEGGRVLHPTAWWTTVALARPVYDAAGLPVPGPATFVEALASCRATREGDVWRLSGTLPQVLGAASVHEILVAGSTGSGMAVFGVRTDGAGVTLDPRPGIDPLRSAADVSVESASARMLMGQPLAGVIMAAARARAVVLLCCEAVGVAAYALETATRYATIRSQFRRPIGSFQAVAHQLAESYADVELARSLAYRAAAVFDAPQHHADQLTDAVACAERACVEAAVRVCETAIQVHGGMGVTWELPLHRWYRRALWIRAFLGRRTDPLAILATDLFGPLERQPS